MQGSWGKWSLNWALKDHGAGIIWGRALQGSSELRQSRDHGGAGICGVGHSRDYVGLSTRGAQRDVPGDQARQRPGDEKWLSLRSNSTNTTPHRGWVGWYC